MIELASVVRQNPRAVFRELADDSGVILHLDTSSYHSVNATGAMLWQLTEEAPTYEDLLAAARATVENAPPELDDEVGGFVLAMVEHDLLMLDTPRGDPSTDAV